MPVTMYNTQSHSNKEVFDIQNKLKSLKRKLSESKNTVDSILLRAAQADDSLAEGFMRLARERQSEMAFLRQRFERVKSGLQEDSSTPQKILELAQNLLKQYVTLKPSQKRQIINSVFSNLELNGVSLCVNCRLPFVLPGPKMRTVLLTTLRRL